jgi:hypothetical protein
MKKATWSTRNLIRLHKDRQLEKVFFRRFRVLPRERGLRWKAFKHGQAGTLISGDREFIRPFCGPASQNLKAYGRSRAVRETVSDNLSIFKAFLDLPQPAAGVS